jgi:hypothetical protein
MEYNEIDEQYSKEFFYKQDYDCADIYIWQGQICISKDYLKKIINNCNDQNIKNILSQTSTKFKGVSFHKDKWKNKDFS